MICILFFFIQFKRRNFMCELVGKKTHYSWRCTAFCICGRKIVVKRIIFIVASLCDCFCICHSGTFALLLVGHMLKVEVINRFLFFISRHKRCSMTCSTFWHFWSCCIDLLKWLYGRMILM